MSDIYVTIHLGQLESGYQWITVNKYDRIEDGQIFESGGFSDFSSPLEEALSLVDAILFHWAVMAPVHQTQGATG